MGQPEHDRGWGFQHGKTPEQHALAAAQKLATAARAFLDDETGRHRDDLEETLKAFNHQMHRVDL